MILKFLKINQNQKPLIFRNNDGKLISPSQQKTIRRWNCDKLDFRPSFKKKNYPITFCEIPLIRSGFSIELWLYHVVIALWQSKLTSRSRWQRAPQPLYDTVFKLASPVRLVEVSSNSGVPIDPTSIEFIISWNISGLSVRLVGNRRLHGFRCMTGSRDYRVRFWG